MSTMQKLRAIAIEAYQKIHANRFKNVPGKWPEKGFSPTGERDWRLCSFTYLAEKLEEESRELIKAAVGEGLGAIRKEAGDVTALAMFIADRAEALNPITGLAKAPRIVCLCGSTRFMEQFQEAVLQETLAERIVLSVGAFHHTDKQLGITPEQKVMLDELHKRKIDLADEILVLNVDGYIGESTRSEIEYAKNTGKSVRYLQMPNN